MTQSRRLLWLSLLLLAAGLTVTAFVILHRHQAPAPQPSPSPAMATRKPPANFGEKLAYAAEDIVDPSIRYDDRYVAIPYPGGDVPAKMGVCTDVVIRAYRRLGVDLQVLVHRDIAAHRAAYPGITRPDPGIDHRRVFVLEIFFARCGRSLPVTRHPADYAPGDLVTWRVGTRGHIGVVSSLRTPDGARPLMVHNIGGGQVLEDMLFNYPIVTHCRYTPPRDLPAEAVYRSR